MAASMTDVREWARQEGLQVSRKGAISKDLRQRYDDAHAEPGTPPEPDYDNGVTEADFPPPFAEPAPAERQPRPPAPARPAARFQKLFDRGKKSKKKHPRVSLADFAEGVWTDLAQVAPFPPLQRMLAIQSPYAATVFDDVVKGTVLDPLIQPAARADQAFRGLSGLIGPPLFTTAICVLGRREKLADGSPGDFDPRTKMMFGALKYSLMQMGRIADVNAEALAGKTQEMEDRARNADALIALLFAEQFAHPAGPDDEPSQQEEDNVRRPRQMGGTPGFLYPQPPGMDGTGADPGRP
jgi:hypothetical protein